MKHHLMARRGACALLAMGVMFSVACSDDNNNTGDGGPTCPAGQTRNPITGQCVSDGRVDPTDPGDMNPDSPDAVRDLPPDVPPTVVEVPEAERCDANLDSDADGLSNACECTLGTEPGNSDTDGDGLPDGYEDANQSCRVDPGETQPLVADTDGDGVDDGDEVRAGLNPLARDTDGDGIIDGVEFGHVCLNPLSADTDGDGLPDGEEDANKDGLVGTCIDRVYAPLCAQGESDPCKLDTSGNGTPDNQEVAYLGCRDEFINALAQPQLATSQPGDYQLALDPGASIGQVSGIASGQAHAFNHVAGNYAGFIHAGARPSGITTPEQMRDHLLARLRTAFPSATIAASGRRTLTHDGNNALVGARVVIGRPGTPSADRDAALSVLAGGTPAHNAQGTFNPTLGDLAIVFTVIERPNNKVIITAAAVSNALYQDRASDTGWLIDDAISANSVAGEAATMETACISYVVDDRAKVDFIWIIDGSGSMQALNQRVASYATTFAGILNASNIDWRLGVVNSHCEGIKMDAAIPADVANLYGSTCETINLPFPLPFPIPMPSAKNGQLCAHNNAQFTNNAQLFSGCVDRVARESTVNEHTVTLAPAAIARAMPRSDTDPSKLRPDAATIVVSVTDEFDDLFQSAMGWRDAGQADDPQNDPTLEPSFDSGRLETIVQPFVDYLLRPEIAATVFGLIWVPGQTCGAAAEAAAGIQRVAEKTGGTVGNICDGNLNLVLQRIAEASVGLASNLRLQGSPISSTIDVRVGNVRTAMLEEPPRHRTDGWDYDNVTNGIAFFGPSPPQTRDRVVITYRRWENSIISCSINNPCPPINKQTCIEGICQ